VLGVSHIKEAAMEDKGRCVICNVKGRSGRDFLCEDCADPGRIFVACMNCRYLTEISAKELEILRDAMGLDFPIRTGITIKQDFCPKCDPENKKEYMVKVYSIRG
jgi:hypothetical protein